VLQKNVAALVWAAITIAIVIVIIDQLFWRPVVAWADKFRFEQSAAASQPSSWVYDIIRSAQIPKLVARGWAPAAELINRALARVTRPRTSFTRGRGYAIGEYVFNFTLVVMLLVLSAYIGNFMVVTVGLREVGRTFSLAVATMTRVLILVAVSTLIWVPAGVAIGFHPRLARALQPVAQFLASFPANILFPFATLAFIRFRVPINFGCILLMALGAQWYVLFNAIAGAQSIPSELREMTADLEVRGWLRWRRLIIPGVFSSWVTGAITASGGAWNASIVSEVVTWGSSTLVATGLGAYITQATSKGDGAREALGICMMSIFVVVINRFVWRRLYRYAQTRFSL
jgi:NitT/TauT family transport system permease protein